MAHMTACVWRRFSAQPVVPFSLALFKLIYGGGCSDKDPSEFGSSTNISDESDEFVTDESSIEDQSDTDKSTNTNTSTESTTTTGSTTTSTTTTTTATTSESNGGCEDHIVDLTAVTLGRPEPFDLIIVADNSDSLSWSRDELAEGLSDLLTSVEGRDLRVFLLTPTQYEASSAAAQSPLSGESLVDWQDISTGKAYENAVTRYTQECTDPDLQPITCPSPTGQDPYIVNGKWDFVMPEPIAVLTPDLTAAQFAEQQRAVTEAILAVGGSGSPNEQPLCTLDRYISHSFDSLSKNAVFLIISDEDDVSSPRECLAGFKGDLEVQESITGRPCSENCDGYTYNMVGDHINKRMDTVCAAFDDLGQQIPGTEENLTISQNLSTCDGFVPGPCDAEEEKSAKSFCKSGNLLVSCERRCENRPGECNLIVPDTTIDACTMPFVNHEVFHYNNMEDYCMRVFGGMWRECKREGVFIDVTKSLSGGFSPSPLVSGEETMNLANYFHNQALARFGAEHYLVEAIALDPAFSCEVQAGQSYATNLVDFVGDRNHVFPLCESYAPALAGVSDFAKTLIKTEFPIELKVTEKISKVFVVARDGSQRMLAETEYWYDDLQQILHLGLSVLSVKDESLKVEITAYCPPD